MAKDGVPGEVSGVLDAQSIIGGGNRQHGNSLMGGIADWNGSARTTGQMVNIGENGKTTTDVMVSVVVAKPVPDDPKLKKDPEANTGAPQRVAQTKGVINNTQVDAAPEPARLGAAPAAAVSSSAPTARLGKQPGRGLVASASGPVAKPKAAGPLTVTPKAGSTALASKKNDGPRVEGSEAQPDPKAKPQRFVVEEKQLLVKNLDAHVLRQQITNLQTNNGASGGDLQSRDQQGSQNEHGPQHGRRPQYGNAMPRHALEDGPTPTHDDAAPQIMLDKPAPKAAPQQRITPASAKYAQGAIAPPSPHAKA